jgi:hypothetical protein
MFQPSTLLCFVIQFPHPPMWMPNRQLHPLLSSGITSQRLVMEVFMPLPPPLADVDHHDTFFNHFLLYYMLHFPCHILTYMFVQKYEH